MADELMEFSQYLSEHGYSRRTIQGYRADIHQYEQWVRKQRQPSNGTQGEELLSWQTLQSFLEALQQTGVSPGTQNRMIAAVRAFARYKNESLRIETSLSGISRVTHNPQPTPDATRKDLRALIKEFHRQRGASRTERQIWHAVRNWAILHVLRETGLRAGKICALCVESDAICYEAGIIRELFPGFDLSTAARQALMDWLNFRKPGPGQLFTSYSGKPLQPCDLYRLLRTLGNRADVHITPEMLR
jgi:site-specific recombinase XerD